MTKHTSDFLSDWNYSLECVVSSYLLFSCTCVPLDVIINGALCVCKMFLEIASNQCHQIFNIKKIHRLIFYVGLYMFLAALRLTFQTNKTL